MEDNNSDNDSVQDIGDNKSDFYLEQLDSVKTVGTGKEIAWDSIQSQITKSKIEMILFHCRHICPSVPVSAQTFLPIFCT